MAHLFIFGLGYSAKRIKRSLECLGWTVEATGSEADIAFDDKAADLGADHLQTITR